MNSTGTARLRENRGQNPDERVYGDSLLADDSPSQWSLVPYLRLFWANRQFLFRAGAVAMAISMVIALLIPAQYEGVTRLMPPDSQANGGLGILAAMASGRPGGGGGLAASGLGALAGDVLGLKSTGALFVGILSSETVEDNMINRFHLMKLYHESKIEDARKTLAQHTSVSEDRKSGIITITVTDHDPQRAAAMAQAYVSELDLRVAQVSTSSARRERIFLEERLSGVKSDLDTAARQFSDFASKNTAIDIPAQGKAMVEAAAMLQGQLIAAQSELSGLRQIYADTNVRVRTAEARVAELQKKLNEVGGAGTPGELKNDNSLYPSIRKLPLLGVTYADLYRQNKIQETVYELLTEQYELAKVQEAKEIPTVKVLDVATVPTKKSFPPRGLIAIVGTLLGLAVALCWLSAKSRWDAIEANDPRKEFASEVFATVQPLIPGFSRNGSTGNSNGHKPWAFWKKSENEDGATQSGTNEELDQK